MHCHFILMAVHFKKGLCLKNKIGKDYDIFYSLLSTSDFSRYCSLCFLSEKLVTDLRYFTFNHAC